MIIKRVNGTATVQLTAEDCALLAQACTEAREAGCFAHPATLTSCAALGAAFAALGLACSAGLSMRPESQREWSVYLAQLELGDLVSE